MTERDPDGEAQTEADAEAEPESDAEPEPTADPETADAEPEPEPESNADAEPEPEPEPEPDADGVRRVFAPTDGPFAAQLVAVSHAWKRGDMRAVRQGCDAVLAGADATEAERRFAADLLARVKSDPAALGVGVALLGVILWLLLRSL